MKRIAIQLEKGTNIQAAIEICARAIAANYGAGTIADSNHKYLGTWTMYPDSWEDSWIHILVESERSLDMWQMASLVRKKAAEYKPDEVAP